MLARLFGIDIRSLALFRILAGAFLLYNLLTRAADFEAMYGPVGLMPIADVRAFYGDASWAWSLYFLDESSAFQAMLFVVSGVFALLLVAGRFTRTATVASWMLLASLNTRAPLLITGGDVLLAMMLFWGAFLPLGACWSLDARRAAERPPMRVTSVASAAILIQIAFMYFLTGLYKCNEFWFSGQALENVFSYDMLVRPAGQWLLGFPLLLKLMTWSALGLELIAPWLLFSPWKTRPLRLAAWCGLVMLHLGIELTMNVVVFSIASLIALTLFLPAELWQWDALRRRLPGVPAAGEAAATGTRRWRSRIAGAACLVLFVFVIAINSVFNLWGARAVTFVPPILFRLANLTVVGQRWSMFAEPAEGDYRYVALAELNNGERVDVLRAQEVRQLASLDHLSATPASQRWMLVFIGLMRDEHAAFRRVYAEYLAERWNLEHGEAEQVVVLKLLFVRESPGGAHPTVTRWFAQHEPFAKGAYAMGERHGEWVYYFKSGQVRERGRYAEGRREGVWESFHENGRPASRGAYAGGVQQGRWTYWYADGTKEIEGTLVDGVEHGVWRFWYESGEVVEARYEHGRRVFERQ